MIDAFVFLLVAGVPLAVGVWLAFSPWDGWDK